MPPGNGSVRFHLDPDFEAKVLSSPGVRSWVSDLTDQVTDVARELAPFRLGHLEEGIEGVVEFDGSRGRWVGRVVSSDFKTLWKEYGTKRERAQPFLRPALAQVLPGARTSGR